MTEDSENNSGNVNYNPKTGIYSAAYDTDSPSITIIEAMTEITGKDMTELDSLHEATAMDIDALDELFKPTVAGAPQDDGRVTFTYQQYEVTVFSFGRIEIKPLDEDN